MRFPGNKNRMLLRRCRAGKDMRMTSSYRRGVFPHLVLIAALLAGFAGFAPPAGAQATPDAGTSIPSFVLTPVGQDQPYISETLDPGEETAVTVQLGNAGDETTQARTFVADAFTLVNGGFGVKAEDAPKTGSTTWLDYSSETLDLEPGDLVERTVTISVPDDAAPGEYIAGLVLQTAEPIPVADSTMFRQTIQKSIAIFITVPGPKNPALEIGEASIDQRTRAASIQIEIDNPGNVLLKPAGTVTMTDAGGKQIVDAPVKMGSVYAGTSTLLEIALPTTLLPGTYSVHIELSDEATGVAVDEEREAELADLAATPEASPVTIDSLTLEAARDSASDTLQYVNVEVSLTNAGNPIQGAQVILHVTRDGAPVEDFTLASGLAIPVGPTQVAQRYIPPGGWTVGEYAFSVTVEAVTPSGQRTALAEAQSSETVASP
jgi:hypothetical protein